MSNKYLNLEIIEMLEKNDKHLMCLASIIGIAEKKAVVLLKLRSVYLRNAQIQKALLEEELKKFLWQYLKYCPRKTELRHNILGLIKNLSAYS